MSKLKLKPRRRKVDVVVVSDVHLGTYGCHAAELLRYLKSVRPKVLVLNGDIVDIWQFSKSYWPRAHMRVLRYLASLGAKGTKIHYLTGNHDELLRKFAGTQLGNFSIDNKLVLELADGKAWLFHGDIFDVTMQHARWLARLGAHGYDALILLNRVTNYLLQRLGRPRVALSKAVKNRVKGAVNLVSGFEQTAARIAVDNGYRYVACGHIHHPEIKTVATPQGEVVYLNSGDWVENLTALEYSAATGWQLYRYADDPLMQHASALELDAGDQAADMPVEELLSDLLVEFKLTTPAA
ncbi:UDP-2,3-diacylglucosamine diphosphatase [Hymenobacter persicinus]|uniref:UDP-2,3-diacylglucosamine diphosphatase n=1 Tax=Hymenobacter persicinus TaxID=2025506 RepID=A0A4V1ZAZ4_9BACT|nr:UDP-2,3-diacylglucosamine diphosphatase [Hymenobacter persicinus]RYU81314.1 UDP-2,3-diacylglucosamine diphosphatase [Hymenobacter persicinus]